MIIKAAFQDEDAFTSVLENQEKLIFYHKNLFIQVLLPKFYLKLLIMNNLYSECLIDLFLTEMSLSGNCICSNKLFLDFFL